MADLAETLLDLGRCETAVDDLRRQENQLPREIEQVEARAESARETVAAQRKVLEEAETAHRACERELQEAEASKSKFQAQAPMVKTNAEYTALLQEIERTESQISDLETRILESLEEVDEAAAVLGRVESEEREREQAALAEAGTLRARLEEVHAALEQREAERAELAAVLPAEARGRYDRVYRATGLGTSVLVGRSCARCHRDVPFQIINLLQAGELQHCGNCGRILVPAAD